MLAQRIATSITGKRAQYPVRPMSRKKLIREAYGTRYTFAQWVECCRASGFKVEQNGRGGFSLVPRLSVVPGNDPRVA